MFITLYVCWAHVVFVLQNDTFSALSDHVLHVPSSTYKYFIYILTIILFIMLKKI